MKGAKLIIFGPPGSGKGTYSSRIATRLGIAHVATGDILRELAREKTASGKRLASYLERGELVPDEIAIGIVKGRINPDMQSKGFILDGFTRTVAQAKALDGIASIDAVVNLILPQEILVEKIAARRICRKCGAIYNVANIQKAINGITYLLPPMLPMSFGKCDKCGKDIYQREDDTPEVVKQRLRVYENQSKPVIEYYGYKIPFVNIHVNRGPDIVTEQILDQLKNIIGPKFKSAS